MSRSLLDVHPSFVPQVAEWLRVCNAKGVPVYIYCTHRTRERQADLYAIGRDEELKRISGARIVTNAKPGDSLHNTVIGDTPASEAVDAVPYDVLHESRGRPLKFKLDWTPFVQPSDQKLFRRSEDLDLLDPRWRVMVKAADKIGIDWAGRWTGSLVEYVHWSFRRTEQQRDGLQA